MSCYQSVCDNSEVVTITVSNIAQRKKVNNMKQDDGISVEYENIKTFVNLLISVLIDQMFVF